MIMALGPVQVLLINFGPETEFRGEILDELDRLTDRGLIRVLDLGIARRTEDGELVYLQTSSLTAEDAANLGGSVKRLFGAASPDDLISEAVGLSDSSLLAEVQGGIAGPDLTDLLDDLEPGQSVAMLLFEHTWATRFQELVRVTGGVPLMQGFLTPELTLAVGAELAAISEAAAAVEIAEAVRGAAILDAMVTAEAAAEYRAAIAAETVRTLMVAGLLDDAAVNEAIAALYAAELIEEAALAEAEDHVDQVEAEVDAAVAALEAVDSE
jgi:uncharacterized membrane protein